MPHRAITALADRLRAHIALSKSRLETLCLLIVGMVSARTVNLGHIACERGGRGADRLDLPPAAAVLPARAPRARTGPLPLVAATARPAERWTLVLDRTNWTIGRREVNYLVLAVVTRRFRVPLLWTLLPHGGNSSTAVRIALMRALSRAFPGLDHPPPARRPRVHRRRLAEIPQR